MHTIPLYQSIQNILYKNFPIILGSFIGVVLWIWLMNQSEQSMHRWTHGFLIPVYAISELLGMLLADSEWSGLFFFYPVSFLYCLLLGALCGPFLQWIGGYLGW